NDYGRSKWAATQLILNHAEAHQRRHVVARVFNLCGPGQGQKQALGRYTAELASATGTEEILLYAFALDYKRDFLDVRDAARAIIQLADSNTAAGLYHLGRGSSHSIRESLNCLIQYSGHKVTIIEEPPANPMREGVRDSVANITRISHETGWSPEIRFEDSLRDLWADVSSRS
ncbi:MAG: GDP-6-deoxy-D-mannose reductase, partial [Planctomycetota bacterium]